MADINSNTFVNNQITNVTGSHIMCSDGTREADVELQHIIITQTQTKQTQTQTQTQIQTQTQTNTPSGNKNRTRSKSLDSPSKSPSNQLSVASNSVSNENSIDKSNFSSAKLKRKIKKKLFKKSLAKKSKKIFGHLLHHHLPRTNKSRSISPTASKSNTNSSEIIRDDNISNDENEIDISELELPINNEVQDEKKYIKIMIQPQPEEWKRFEKYDSNNKNKNKFKQRSRIMMLTIRADNAQPHTINNNKLIFGDRHDNNIT
eukprot:977504_1